jgi:N-acetylglutamate synthase-like GNAT family acetyltransferase
LYEKTEQIGFARVVTDYAVFAYLLDVVIAENRRSLGLGKWLVEVILNHPKLKEVQSWMLATKDAHKLYAEFGFKKVENPEFYMKLKR